MDVLNTTAVSGRERSALGRVVGLVKPCHLFIEEHRAAAVYRKDVNIRGFYPVGNFKCTFSRQCLLYNIIMLVKGSLQAFK